MKHLTRRILTIALAAAMVSSGTTALAAETTSAAGSPPDKPGSSTTTSVTYSGAETITSGITQTGQTYTSSTADQNSLLVNTSEAVTINDPTVTKTGNSDGGDNCNFYGINSAVMAKGGTTLTITGGTITATATGANGVFSYGGNGGQNGAAGDGTTVKISDSTITTTGGNSGGIMTTGGGVTIAENLTVETSGQSSAPIRTDRGGGTVTVDGGTYTSNGLGSPAIYSTADITVSNAKLVSNLSEGVCIEGKNSITLNNCDLTANNTKTNGNAKFLDTIMIYQSMSGDADSGTSSFTMNGGKLTSKSGHIFHVTNTNAIITLDGVMLVNEDGDNVILSVCDDGWSGASNIATLNASNQTLDGDMLVGSDSTLTLKLTDGSTFTGTVSGNITNASGSSVSSSVGTVNVTLDSTSTWTLTADTYITSFSGTAANVKTNGYTLYVNGTPLSDTTVTDNTDTSTASSDTDTTTSAVDSDTDLTSTDNGNMPTPPDGNDSDRPTPPDWNDSDRPTPPDWNDSDRPTPPDMSDTDIPTPPEGDDSDRPTPPETPDSDSDKWEEITDEGAADDTSVLEENTVKIGDVDRDGQINSSDALNVLRGSVNNEEFDDQKFKTADVNGDGVVDSADSLEILRHSVGLSAHKNIGKRFRMKK